MKLITLGTGTYQPELNKSNACYLIKTDDKNIVIDFGRGAINQLLKVNIEYHQIDAIFITHPHADHCNDLSSLFHIALAEPKNKKLRKNDLIIYGPEGINNTIEHLLMAFNLDTRNPQYKIIVKEIKDKEIINLDSITVQGFKVKHSDGVNCFSYRIEKKNTIISLSGDTGICDGLINSIKNSDLAILEASITNDEEPLSHLNPKAAINIAKENQVKKIVLSHISPEVYEDIDNIQDEDVIIAKDLMEFDV